MSKVKEASKEDEIKEDVKKAESFDATKKSEDVVPTESVEEDDKEEVKEEKKGPKVDSMESLMEELGDNILPFAEGDLVEAKVLSVGGARIWVDVSGQSLGFVPEREMSLRAGLKRGDSIFATVISMDDEEGNVVLSMKQADREKFWVDMQKAFDSGEAVAATITDANKGGLISEVGGIQGFLPVSQLSPKNYPRVEGGDRDEILNRLRQFTGTDILVKVINCDRENNKLIFSERAVNADEVKNKVDKYAVGDKVKGKITGIVDFGLFVSVDAQIEGLIHISEVSWSRVSDLNKLFRVGDEVETMIIGTDEGRVSLSLKRLLPDPWVKAASKFKIGDKVDGTITKITPFGAFVSIENGIDGLVHVSELSDEHVVDPGQIVELGKPYGFKIVSIEPESHRLGLSLKAVKKADKAKDSDAPKKSEESVEKDKKAEKPAEETKEEAKEDVVKEDQPKVDKSSTGEAEKPAEKKDVEKKKPAKKKAEKASDEKKNGK